MKNKNHWTHESGASIISVMVAMALFAVVAVMASQSFRNINVSNRRADASMSARDAESVIVQAVVTQYKAFVLGNCANVNLLDAGIPIGALATLRNDVKFEFKNHDRNAAIATPAIATTDVTRCTETAFIKGVLPAVDSFYSCFTVETDANAQAKASADAFAANRGAFIEVYVRLRNLQTDALVTCNNIVANRGFGLEVLYSMHWATASGSRTNNEKATELTDFFYDSKTGSLSAAL